MEAQIKLVYQGRRLTSKNKLVYSYGIVGSATMEYLWFSKPLDGVKYNIGRALTCIRTETGVSAPYKIDFDYTPSPEEVRDWSMKEKADVEWLQEMVDAKKIFPGDVKEFVDYLKRLSRADRVRIIKYLITQFL